MRRRWIIMGVLGLMGVLLSSHLAAAVPYATGKMRWSWTRGASPDDLDALEFRVSCGLISGQYTFPVKTYAPADRIALVKDAIPVAFIQIQRKFYCVVVAWNGAEFASSAEIVVDVDSQLAAPVFVGFE